MKGLSKYPVITEEGNYRVDINKSHIAFGMYCWIVYVYVKNDKKTFFNRKEFTRVYEYETGWCSFEEHAVNLVGLAEKAVRTYEEEVVIFNRNFDASIKKFEKWDGNLL